MKESNETNWTVGAGYRRRVLRRVVVLNCGQISGALTRNTRPRWESPGRVPRSGAWLVAAVRVACVHGSALRAGIDRLGLSAHDGSASLRWPRASAVGSWRPSVRCELEQTAEIRQFDRKGGRGGGRWIPELERSAPGPRWCPARIRNLSARRRPLRSARLECPRPRPGLRCEWRPGSRHV